MNMQSFLPYARQSIDASDIEAASQAMAGDLITRGPMVEAFEQAIAHYCGAKHAIAFNTGTTALIAACHAADVGPNDHMITTPNTFVASAIAGMHRGCTPIFVDIDRKTGNLNLEQAGFNLEQQLSRGRHIVLPVHFAGIAVDMERLESMVQTQGSIIIEDAAHALGSAYPDGQKVGCCAWSQMTIFSFHPAKTITAGEGGMVTTNDDDLAHRLRRYRNNGIERDPQYLVEAQPPYDGYYEVMEMTGNYNFTEFQAALGLSQFARIEQFIEKRRQLVSHYRKLLNNVPHLQLLSADYDDRTAFHLCVAQIDFAAYNTTRGHVISQLKERDIGTQVHYIPVYHHPFFKEKHGDISPYFPEMEAYFSQALSLPLYYDLTLEDVERVVRSLLDVLHSPGPHHHRPRHHHVRPKRR